MQEVDLRGLVSINNMIADLLRRGHHAEAHAMLRHALAAAKPNQVEGTDSLVDQVSKIYSAAALGPVVETRLPLHALSIEWEDMDELPYEFAHSVVLYNAGLATFFLANSNKQPIPSSALKLFQLSKELLPSKASQIPTPRLLLLAILQVQAILFLLNGTDSVESDYGLALHLSELSRLSIILFSHNLLGRPDLLAGAA